MYLAALPLFDVQQWPQVNQTSQTISTSNVNEPCCPEPDSVMECKVYQIPIDLYIHYMYLCIVQKYTRFLEAFIEVT